MLRLLAVFAMLVATPSFAFAATAFPGAKGAGVNAQGGRGGALIFVDSLANSGPGSLRSCVEATGIRTCIFRIGGTVNLTAPLVADAGKGYLTILGQTAPGMGIQLTIGNPSQNWPIGVAQAPLLLKDSTEFVIRHMGFRPRFNPANTTEDNSHCIIVEGTSNVYLNHLSCSWADDENITFLSHSGIDTTNITIDYSIIADGLNPHSKCVILLNNPSQTGAIRITFANNACINNNDRDPDVNARLASACIDIVNNIFFNAKSDFGEIWTSYGGTRVNFRNNTFKGGHETVAGTAQNPQPAIEWMEYGTVANPNLFHVGNEVSAPPGKFMTLLETGTWGIAQFAQQTTQNCPGGLPFSPLPLAQMYEEVWYYAGAFPQNRNSFDVEKLAEMGLRGVHTGQGDTPSVPGPLPTISGGTPYADTDNDGMPDVYEAALGAVVGPKDHWADGDGNGISNLDQAMDRLNQCRTKGAWVPPFGPEQLCGYP